MRLQMAPFIHKKIAYGRKLKPVLQSAVRATTDGLRVTNTSSGVVRPVLREALGMENVREKSHYDIIKGDIIRALKFF